MKNNYVQIIPNSHFFSDFNQIIATLRMFSSSSVSKEMLINDLLIGIENSIKNGYEIVKVE
jgi:hypothetical protein